MAENDSDIDSLKTLQQQIEQLCETSRQVGIIASDFQATSQKVLNDKLRGLITNLREINDMKEKFDDIEVPLEVFSYIDEGRNPELYTKACLDKVVMMNQEMKGKVDAYKNFKTTLCEGLAKVFPKEMEAYLEYRDSQ
ncbi:Mediator of RNA polymerase II transcription subunit 10 [Trichoplax sp. H2]|uniref:Mediator of RNA polymerase II transcription subunit 10 n=1 Tax=Trichoplax adhaerens TaxID=10228 RepID=B3RVJ4_TRIAD|nr:hypothetical protein TRIADDRAFT_24417 [Trichoplax adhaerens]EDV26006.1 hypothetical protein TRIADDRAFT_24417 [Trichoplax adhaerens]RDD47041.1 Mediator of RNA polymerase II transcription subunit 10 [Trichoplax sp. H2]|eukprot:XP_002112039.1 hypothetical protein TRIADDRAFT_24417 [Trichoplax adhaerens]